jgi:DNA-binding CsgD family transcriptional regulator
VRGDYGEAAAQFRVAADLWRDRHARGELRCLWGRGESLRRAGDPAALPALEEVEARALELDGLAVHARIRRSLRLAGAPRSGARTKRTTGLTGRESEVLDLVARGLTNAVIARRLGVSRPTVVTLIRSAQDKLGATSRAQAAALAAQR